ncbi:MAG: Carotene 7,8-desaturase [Gemmataceae bacterium]|nr:Carotene 7,8-desaturase [Gemmataceae bacterium]
MDRCGVVIVGSGLAGMTAAYRLTKAGRRVTVLEAGPVLGGRTSSWVEGGMPVDSGLHKFLGIYRALPALLRDVGMDPHAILSWEDAVQIHVPDEPVHAYFRAAPVHKPVRTLLTALGNNRIVPPLAKLALTYMGAGGLRECAAHPLELDGQNVYDYARRSGVSEWVCRRLLAAVTQGVLFMPPEEFSAYAVFAPVLEGLKSGMTFRVGAFKGGMTDVMIRPIASAVEKLGGRVRTNARVTRLAVESGRVVGVEVGDEKIPADHVVLAVALKPAQELIRAALPDYSWFAPMLSLGTLSAVTVQMELDGPALPSDHTNFSTGALCCFAEQSRTTFTHARGRLSVILSRPGSSSTWSPGRSWSGRSRRRGASGCTWRAASRTTGWCDTRMISTPCGPGRRSCGRRRRRRCRGLAWRGTTRSSRGSPAWKARSCPASGRPRPSPDRVGACHPPV